MYAISFMTIDNYFSHCSVLKEEKKTYCHMVYYIKNWEAIFDAFKKIRQIDGKLRAMTFFLRDFLVQ